MICIYIYIYTYVCHFLASQQSWMTTLAILIFVRYFIEESSMADVMWRFGVWNSSPHMMRKKFQPSRQAGACNKHVQQMQTTFQRLYLNLFSSIPASMFEVIYLAPSIDQNCPRAFCCLNGQCSGSCLAPMGRNHALGATAFYVYLHPGISLKHIEGTGFGPKKMESRRLGTEKKTLARCEGDTCTCFQVWRRYVHPWKVTFWTPKMEMWKRIFLFKLWFSGSCHLFFCGLSTIMNSPYAFDPLKSEGSNSHVQRGLSRTYILLVIPQSDHEDGFFLRLFQGSQPWTLEGIIPWI